MFQKVDHEGSLGVKSWWQQWRKGSTKRAIALARGRARTEVRIEGGNGYHMASVPGAGWSPASTGGGSSGGLGGWEEQGCDRHRERDGHMVK